MIPIKEWFEICDEDGDNIGSPYDLGWQSGYNDELPSNPFPEGSEEAKEWQEGYEQGSSDC
jgi:hypothetical protein